MRSPKEYKESLKRMRPNVYKFGELIEDVTTHPATRRTVEGHAKLFWAAMSERWGELFSKESSLIGERVSRYLTLIKTPEDMVANCRMKRAAFNLTGTCTGGRCVGWNAINAMWATAYEMARDGVEWGEEYSRRLMEWLIWAQKEDITLSGALTDPKGDRTKGPGGQKDPLSYLKIVEKDDEGITVRGAKIMIAGVAAANYIFVLPGRGMREGEEDYAVSFVVPRDEEGITCVEARHPSDLREMEEGWDNPVERGGITQSYVLFDDVRIPWERVFMAGEAKYSGRAVMNFIRMYRASIGGCVAGQGDLMAASSVLIARANGLQEKAFRAELAKMVVNNETTFAVGVAASLLGEQHPSGIWLPSTLLSNVNKVHVGTLPYETKRLAQEIAGGIAETGCMPSFKDLQDERYGELLKRYLSGATDPEIRIKLARFIEWLTVGGGIPGTMHGGGSPGGARMMLLRSYPMGEYIERVRELLELDRLPGEDE